MTALSESRAIEIIRSFRDRRLLVIGDAMLDKYVFGKVERLNPEAPVPILQATREKHETGGAGNVAKNAAALGARTTLITAVGDDYGAALLEQAARSEGYTPILIRDRRRTTIEKRRYIVNSQQLLRVDREAVVENTPEIDETICAEIAAHAARADAIIVSDYAKGTITEAVARATLAAAREHDIPVMADVKPNHVHLFTGVTYLSPNRKEAHEYLGLNQHINGGVRAAELASRLRERFDANIFLTLSADGIFVLTRDAPEGIRVPQLHRIEVADTSGCGDTAAVALVLALRSGADPVDAAHIANAAGAVVATRIGAVAITPDDLLEAIREIHHLDRSETQADHTA